MGRNRKHDFSNAQRAEIYRRDLATCVYSGRRLWVLDVGADWRFPVEWADHVTAVANGGKSQVDNGVCAHWRTNLKKGASAQLPEFLFHNGKPTTHYFALSEPTRQSMADSDYLSRMERLDETDWYFNRALINLLMGTAYLHEYVGKRKRDHNYYARTVLRFLAKWRSVARRNNSLSLEDRGLISQPSPDQQIMLNIRDENTVDQVIDTMQKLIPFYAASKYKRHHKNLEIGISDDK